MNLTPYLYLLRKSQPGLFDPHHIAYVRRNARGTVSQIQAKGAPRQDQMILDFTVQPSTPAPPKEASFQAFIDSGRELYETLTAGFDVKKQAAVEQQMRGEVKNIGHGLSLVVDKLVKQGVEKYWVHPDYITAHQAWVNADAKLKRLKDSGTKQAHEEILKHFKSMSKPAECQARAKGVATYLKKSQEKALAEFYEIAGWKATPSLYSSNKIRTSDRAHASETSGTVCLSDWHAAETVHHEAAHHIEFSHSEIAKAARMWRYQKAEKSGSATPKPLNKIVKGSGYRDDENALQDKFVDPYVGKVYGKGSTEVISMGMQYLSTRAGFKKMLEKDPKHLHFMLGMLQYLRGKQS